MPGRLLCFALCALALGCGRHKPLAADAGSDARDGAAERGDTGDVGEAAPDAAADAGDGAETDAPADGGDGGVGLPPLSPPTVSCAPYDNLTSCNLHVSSDGKSGGDGLTWASAFRDVQDALDRATCGCRVWIAAGTYSPTRGPDATDPDPRARAFLLWPGVQVFGGFAGDESSLDDRKEGNKTILSGEFDIDTREDNAYHVVWAWDSNYLERVTITGGHANGFNVGQGVGAGVFVVRGGLKLWDAVVAYNDAGSGGGLWIDGTSQLYVVRGTFQGNVADVGGAIATSATNTSIDGTTFLENVGVFVGGAVASQSKSLSVRGATFKRNRGDFGASVALSAGDGQLSQCWFEGNIAGLFGGALFLRLGSHARLSNSVAVANSSVGHGGALTVWTASLDVDQSTIVDNSAAFGGAIVVKDGAKVSMASSVLWRNSDDTGKTFFLDGADNQVTVTSSDLPTAEAPGSTDSFDEDPLLGNVPLATRFAESLGTSTERMTLAQADQHFKVGDRIELGDDGVERRVTDVLAGSIGFAPPWSAATPRWLRVDKWAAGAPSLALDLVPTADSPLIGAVTKPTTTTDLLGNPRVGNPDIGALEYQFK
jgi:hypothetical protein